MNHRISPQMAEMLTPGGGYSAAYGQFLPRPSQLFTDGAFAPASPIYPTPVDQPTHPGGLAGPRWWEARVGWNLPTPPGTEGLKLASFDTLRTLSEKYSVARACLEIRIEEIRSLEWDITLTTDAAKAYQGDRAAMRDFGERKAEAKRFFRRPDPDFWNFDTFLSAFLEEVFVYDALSLIFRPKFGATFGMGGKGLLGSDLDSLRLVSGPTIRPLIDLHGGTPRPPAPAYQQFLYGVPRSDYMTIATGQDIEEAGLAGSEVNMFDTDIMLYAPYWRTRESPYGFPPVERALLPIISGLQKQEFQLDYFTEGTIPAVYISPGDANITPTQIGELQSALNALAGDPAYHLKVVVLPPGSRVEPQRPIDLSDSFDYLVMNQVLMAFDCQPTELGIIPDIGATSQGPGASAVRFAGQQKRDIKSRVSAKPLLKWICDIFNYILQDICQQPDMQFQFEGLVDDEDKAAITELGVQQIQNGMASIDEVRERLDLPPWGLPETSEPVLFTAQGAIPLAMSTELIQSTIQNNQSAGQGTNSGRGSGGKTKQPNIRQGGQTRPNGGHPAPVAPHRDPVGTPQHAAAAGVVQSPTPRTGGSANRSTVAGSRKKNPTPSRRTISGKAAAAELDALRRHLRKGREITSWEPRNIDNHVLAMVAEDLAKGVLIDVAIARAQTTLLVKDDKSEDEEREDRRRFSEDEPHVGWVSGDSGDGDDEDDDEDDDTEKIVVPDELKTRQFPGWEHDLGLIGRYKQEISRAFQDAEVKGAQLRKKAATGQMYVSSGILRGLVSDVVREVFAEVMTPMWTKAWNLGYESAEALVTGQPPDFGRTYQDDNHLQGFLGTEGGHWLEQVSRTGLGNSQARSEIIARTEVARAVNAAAIQCYRDHGVQYKHLLVAPDDTCDICVAAKNEGIIPLDSIFPNSGLGGPFHPNCVIGSTLVSASSRIRGASVRDYIGEFVIVRTASGNELTATPNHPVATDKGWVLVGDLQPGDHVLSSFGTQWEMNPIHPDINDIPARIEDIAHAFPVALAAMPVSPEDFHGDGTGSDVCIVRTDSLLEDNLPGRQVHSEHTGELHLSGGNVWSPDSQGFDTDRSGEFIFQGALASANGIMGSGSEPRTISRGRPGHSDEHGITAVPGLDASLQQSPSDYGTADSEGFCERLLALSPEVTLDKVINIKRDVLATQVYNLETDDGWYTANNVVTHNCRCVPAPAGVTAIPPQAHIGKRFIVIGETKRAAREDSSRLAWLLLRAEDEDGKYRFLLQQRSEGTWGMPGGTPHLGEDPWKAAVRETTEEIGDLPALKCVRTFHHVEDDIQVYLYLCDVPYFQPKLNGSTPEETQGAAWFRRKEIGDLDLTPKFRDDWEHGITLKDNVTKVLDRNETGMVLTPEDNARGGGSRWPYPHRGDATEIHPVDTNSGRPVPAGKTRPGGGFTPEEVGATEPPRDFNPQEAEAPEGSDDGSMPQRRGVPHRPKKFPDQGGEHDPMYPQGHIASSQSPGISIGGD